VPQISSFGESLTRNPSVYGEMSLQSALVTQSYPLRVSVLGTEMAPDAAVHSKAHDPWTVGDRLWVLLHKGRALVLGYQGFTGYDA
jgi:hypothetical protein